MNKRPVETVMGIVVLIIAAFFLYFAYQVSNIQVVKGYEVSANFLKIGGLNVGADVRINGVKVGSVVGVKLNNQDFDAEVKLSISREIELPVDSSAVIASNGLMGNKFIKIEPGKSTTFLKDRDIIKNTKDFKTLEDMVGEVIFMVTGNENSN